jgi:small subunit ribosomal protein S27Ae
MVKKERARKEKKQKKRVKSRKSTHYKGEGGSVKRERKSCPKCGPGVLMAKHTNRAACGNCGYTEHNVKA